MQAVQLSPTRKVSHNDSMNRESDWPQTFGEATTDSALGVILVDHGSRVAESNAMLEQLAERWQANRPNVFIEPAHMELAKPNIAAAFDACVARGATHIAVSPFFLLPGRHWKKDIPELVASAAESHPGVSWKLAAPMSLHPLVIDILESRINTCLAEPAN